MTVVDISNKIFWHKQFHWPIDDLKISNLKEASHYKTKRITFYGRGSIPSSVIVKYYLDNNNLNSIQQYKKHKQENLLMQYLQKRKIYPSPKLYYARVNDAKRESLLIIEDLHPQFIVLKSNHLLTSPESNALIDNLNLLLRQKISRKTVLSELSFLKKPIHTIITPLEVDNALRRITQLNKLSTTEFNAIASNTIPLLPKIIKLLKSFKFAIVLEDFSPTYLALSTNHKSSIFINYKHFRIGNILDNVVAIFGKEVFTDNHIKYLYNYLEKSNFRNKSGLSDIDLVKVNTYAHKLTKIIECDCLEDIDSRFISSLIDYSFVAKNILSSLN